MGLGYHLTEKLKFDPTSGVVLNDGTWVRLFAAWASVRVCFRLVSFLCVTLCCLGFCPCLFPSCLLPLCDSLLLWPLFASVSVLSPSVCGSLLLWLLPVSVSVLCLSSVSLFFCPCLCLSPSSVSLFVALASVRICVCLLPLYRSSSVRICVCLLPLCRSLLLWLLSVSVSVSFLCVALCCFGFCPYLCLSPSSVSLFAALASVRVFFGLVSFCV